MYFAVTPKDDLLLRKRLPVYKEGSTHYSTTISLVSAPCGKTLEIQEAF